MQRTSTAMLIGVGGFIAAVSAILTWRFYGSMTTIPVTISISLWVMTVICLFAAFKIKGRVEENMIGQDSSQMNPVTVAQLMVLGQACAWAGAIVGGVYVGVSSYIIPRVGDLIAASEDLPGALASALGGIALAAAGLYLERSCEVPPTQSGETIS